MKLYILGPVASGKTTLANRLARQTGTPCFHLDQVAHEPDPQRPGYNRKRDSQARDDLFRQILQRDSYILEDTGRACFVLGMEQADQLVLLEPSPLVRRWRVLARWLRQNLGLEACAYHPGLDMLGWMFRWSRDYETGRDGVRDRAARFSEKLTVLRSKRDIRRFVQNLER